MLKSVVVPTFINLFSEPETVRVLPGISIKHLRKLDNNQLPDGCIKKTPELEYWLGKLLKTAPQSSKEQVSERYFFVWIDFIKSICLQNMLHSIISVKKATHIFRKSSMHI